MTQRLRRSVLYMPASNARAVTKARALPCDAVILDLEDGVSADKKTEARQQMADEVAKGGFGARELIVRVNAIDSAWVANDLAALAANPPHAVLFPKINSATDVDMAEYLMTKAGLSAEVKLWAMIETPDGILNCASIGRAGKRVDCLVVGTNDLAKELGVPNTTDRASMVTALQMAVLGARTAGLSVIDGVYNAIADAEGYMAQCAQGRAFGFDGKTCIHPNQVEGANASFGPSDDDIAHAKSIIAAWEASGKAGVIQVDGVMVEELHVEIARRLLETASD